MKPLLVLVATFILSIFAVKLFSGAYDFAFSARIAMCCMLLFTAIGHFAFVSGMMMMIPLTIPFKKAIVYLTGLLEITLGVGLLFNNYHQPVGYLLILFFMVVLPANIYAAKKRINYQTADHNGEGIGYLFFRVPLQLLFIVWVLVSAILD